MHIRIVRREIHLFINQSYIFYKHLLFIKLKKGTVEIFGSD